MRKQLAFLLASVVLLATVPGVAFAHSGHRRVAIHVGGSVVVRGPRWVPVRRPPHHRHAPAVVVHDSSPGIAPRVRIPVGVGLFTGSLRLKHSGADAQSVGGLLRLRLSPNVALDGEIAESQFIGEDRRDLRIGGTLLVNVARRGALAPYLLVGVGLNAIDAATTPEPVTQSYVEGGAGLAVHLGAHFTLAADLRLQGLSLANDDGAMAAHARALGIPERDRAATARLVGVLTF